MGTCLGFAEATLGILAKLTEANPDIVAIFALVSLGMVLLAMYFRDPAFLTFDSRQALGLRVLQEIRDQLPPDLLAAYVNNISPGYLGGQPSRSARSTLWTIEEIQDLERDLRLTEDSE